MPRIFDMTNKPQAGELPVIASGQRARTVQRLQIGITGVGLMILLVGLANIVQDRVRENDAAAVPGAAATVEPSGEATQADPLVEAGVVPGLIASPTAEPSKAAPTKPDGTGTVGQ